MARRLPGGHCSDHSVPGMTPICLIEHFACPDFVDLHRVRSINVKTSASVRLSESKLPRSLLYFTGVPATDQTGRGVALSKLD